jgi:hypothetical protein
MFRRSFRFMCRAYACWLHRHVSDRKERFDAIARTYWFLTGQSRPEALGNEIISVEGFRGEA